MTPLPAPEATRLTVAPMMDWSDRLTNPFGYN
jgi:hypothetical protein